MTAKLPDMGKTVFNVILTGVSGVGLWLFLKSGIVNYITFRTHFAFLDYAAAKWLILLQNLAMLLFFVLIGYVLSEITQKNREQKYSGIPLIWLVIAMIIGIALNIATPASLDSVARGFLYSAIGCLTDIVIIIRKTYHIYSKSRLIYLNNCGTIESSNQSRR